MQSIDYTSWATTYDATRGASQSVVAVVLQTLGTPRNRLLLDIGGGTGNVALPLVQAGFRVAVCDIAPAMLRQAARKLSRQVALVAATAEHLPYHNESLDCAICINVVRHFSDRMAAFSEARRVLRDGPLVMHTTTQETERAHWAHAYFPTLAHHQPTNQTEDELVADLKLAGFAAVSLQRFHYQGDSDGSFQALKYSPSSLLDSVVAGNLAVFKRLPTTDLADVLERLRGDLTNGRLQQVIAEYQPQVANYGDGVIVTAFDNPIRQST